MTHTHAFSSLRARWLRRVVIAIVAFVLFMLVDALLPIFPPPTIVQSPKPTPRTDGALFYFPSLPTWSTITLDGLELEEIPRQGAPTPLHVSTGVHTLKWQAEPFQSWQCTLRIPIPAGQENDICQTQALGYAEQTYLLLIPVSLQLLPEEQRAELVQTAQATFDSLTVTETVQPGERYTFSYQSDQIFTATEELTATRYLQLYTDATRPGHCEGLSLGRGCFIGKQDCRFFCTLENWPLSHPEIPQWNIAALFYDRWEYRSADGKLISPEASEEKEHRNQFVTLQVSWKNERWSVNLQDEGKSTFDNPLCIEAAGVVLTETEYQRPRELDESISWGFGSHVPETSSCLAAGYLQADKAQARWQPSYLLLYRFGVFYTANEKARQIWPTLPAANMKAQQLAQDLVGHIRI